MDSEARDRISLRTIEVTYRSAIRHASEAQRPELARRALNLLDNAFVDSGSVEIREQIERLRDQLRGADRTDTGP